MRILIAPDKFKHSFDASEVADAIAAGLREVLPETGIETLPIADGGEGTAECIHRVCGGDWRSCAAHDALGREIEARYLRLAKQPTAIIEMNEAAGLWRIQPNERDILRADTFGVGEMILDAAKNGAREIIVGLGGSATNDGGFGMARALGFSFRDEHDCELRSAAELLQLQRIVRPSLSLPKIVGACDVRSPLLGERGATAVFSRQKGASVEQGKILEMALKKLADIAQQSRGEKLADTAGAGAAGGLGFGLLAFCDAEVRSGFEVVAELINLERAVREADVIITGEGKLDRQTLDGKAPARIAALARKFGKRVFAIVGCASDEPGIRKIFDGVLLLSDSPNEMRDAKKSLESRARDLGALLAR